MHQRARTELCGGRGATRVPTATTAYPGIYYFGYKIIPPLLSANPVNGVVCKLRYYAADLASTRYACFRAALRSDKRI